MTILNRLKKLARVGDDSTFCACYPQQNFDVYIQDLGADAETNEPVLSGAGSPDICPDCLKPTEKNSITVQLCDGTTKDRFPDEWKANRNK
jgi:hypothetical protein